jgi:quercetin dioxygenase-like cupin family protein
MAEAATQNAATQSARGRWPEQYFAVSHLREEDFDHGLRPYSAYRDLGFAKATGGKVQAHVIRMTKPYEEGEVSTPHYHDVDFQMVYVLKGWFRSEFEGHGAHTFKAGSSWIQPPKIKHTVIGYSDDCELLEIVLPADFETVTLGK